MRKFLFFANNKFFMLKVSNNISEGLAFDDVLVVPSYSEVLPNEVETSTNFSKNIKLNIPIVSSAMDTVSESSMAISLAKRRWYFCIT